MKRTRAFFFAFILTAAALAADGPLNPSAILKPTPDMWPTFHGDYSGRRFSPLNQINASNVKSLSLAWIAHGNTGDNSHEPIKATPLVVNGVLYFTLPDHAYAID